MEKNKLYKIPKEVFNFLNTKLILIFLVFLPITVFLFLITIPMFIIIVIYINLKYNNISFLINDNELIFNHGIIAKHSKNVILSKIQNINIGQGILERIFRIKSVRIWTASQEQISSHGKNIKVLPSILLYLKNEDVDNFKVLLNKN